MEAISVRVRLVVTSAHVLPVRHDSIEAPASSEHVVA